MYEKLNPKARNLMLMGDVVWSLILSGVWFGLYLLLKNVVEFKYAGVCFAIVMIGTWVISLIAPFVRYERYRYRFTEEEIDIKEGFIWINRNVVPIERLHKISMVSGPFDRMFGLSKVIVTTAGGDVVIRFMETKKAEEIVENLKKRINSYAVAQRERG